MAEALREPPSTVQSWKTTGRVPATKQPLVLSRAEELGLDVTAMDVVFPLNERLACSDLPSVSYRTTEALVPCDRSGFSQRVAK